MATTWFGDKERGTATAFGSMAMPLGCLLSFLLPNLFFDSSKKMEKNELEFYILI
jgi:sugar phosphate permease